MKDIFIDNNIARKLMPPVTGSYKALYNWLLAEGCLVISQKLLQEYKEGLAHHYNQSIISIIAELTKYGRLNNIKPAQIRAFSFKKHEEKNFRTNHRDRDHIKTVFLSARKIAISSDINFRNDVNGFRKVDKIQPTAVSSPSAIKFD